MKTISNEQFELLEDLSSEIKTPLQILEKDILVTELLRDLDQLQVWHKVFIHLPRGQELGHDTGVSFVFAGGTCLSKANNAIQRMSEDIDLKVVLSDIPNLRKLPSGLVNARPRLRALSKAVFEMLQNNGWICAEVEKRDIYDADHDYNHMTFNIPYASRYQPFQGLRENIKLEFFAKSPILESENISLGYLYERSLKADPTVAFSYKCIPMQETLSEKVISILRRYAQHKDNPESNAFDSTLVRHVYDVHCIHTILGGDISRAEEIFGQVVEVDVRLYGTKYEAFQENPIEVLQRSLHMCEENGELEGYFNEKVQPLLYESETVTFQEAFETFKAVANSLLGKLALELEAQETTKTFKP